MQGSGKGVRSVQRTRLRALSGYAWMQAWSRDQAMKSFQYWTWIAITLLALTVIAYVATPSLRSNSAMVAHLRVLADAWCG
jgi:hypothetical protein